MLYEHKRKSIRRCRNNLSPRTQFSFTEKMFSSTTRFEYFKSAKSQKCNQYFIRVDFFQVRLYFYEQSHWTTEMSLVFLKYLKTAKHWAASAGTWSINKHGEGILCVTRGVLQKVLCTNLPHLPDLLWWCQVFFLQFATLSYYSFWIKPKKSQNAYFKDCICLKCIWLKSLKA